MNLSESKPLQPLSGGVVLLVGIKASNLDDELRTHPRIVLWDSQQQHWTNKEFPTNTRAVFLTRFVSHNIYDNIMKEARKKHITVFNPIGTGLIKKQVRELLDLRRNVSTDVSTVEDIPKVFSTPVPKTVSTPTITSAPSPTTSPTPSTEAKMNQSGKLKPLIPFIDFTIPRTQAAKKLLAKAKELGIETTEGSMGALYTHERRKKQGDTYVVNLKTRTSRVIRGESDKTDVVVQMLDNMVRELKDMRQFLKETNEENRILRMRVEKLKKALND